MADIDKSDWGFRNMLQSLSSERDQRHVVTFSIQSLVSGLGLLAPDHGWHEFQLEESSLCEHFIKMRLRQVLTNEQAETESKEAKDRGLGGCCSCEWGGFGNAS